MCRHVCVGMSVWVCGNGGVRECVNIFVCVSVCVYVRVGVRVQVCVWVCAGI